ncbi:hypothetical protein D9758_009527 [Tetrapyrgos nigripes]|uniref:Uncharacterized protein n=1 Tax=Tetrapyrgos nigripes TaxID=182062 RepID=A0A8H5G116_9AGAR|nr:hypothetical protein D9758_009527 [Tetrapyrgos nigripes]
MPENATGINALDWTGGGILAALKRFISRRWEVYVVENGSGYIRLVIDFQEDSYAESSCCTGLLTSGTKRSRYVLGLLMQTRNRNPQLVSLVVLKVMLPLQLDD